MAVSDGEWEDVVDLLDSLRAYVGCSWRAVCVDDATRDGTNALLREAGCHVIRNAKKLHLYGNHVTLFRGLREALRTFDAPLVVKIDPDALVIGAGLRVALSTAFAAHPLCGLLGAFHVDWNGTQRDMSFWQKRMTRRRADLGEPLRRARANGYLLGDGVQGGCYALRRPCLAAIERAGWLDGADGFRPSAVRGKQVAEDHLITMLTYAAGYTVGELGGPGQAFGLSNDGLPAPPEKLVSEGRLVVHALNHRDEAAPAARDFFRARREEHVRTMMGPP
jgi:hypothetical protein